jgi:hypothetical protein
MFSNIFFEFLKKISKKSSFFVCHLLSKDYICKIKL